MNIAKALILGIVQGFTEFLPVSSSGHLVIFRQILHTHEALLFFDVMVHVGTLLAVVFAFREELRAMLVSLVPGRGHPDERHLVWLVVAASIPTVIIALVLKPLVERAFSSPVAVGAALIVTGFFLFLGERLARETRTLSDFTFTQAVIAGLFQGLAVFPGISRSGATISSALMMGLKKDHAAGYSFIMSIPVILGAAVLEARDLPAAGIGGGVVLPTIMAMAAAATSGYIAIRTVYWALRGRRLYGFAVYCWGVGILTIAWHLISG
ncbi:MAG TPA: undecaprenyl-diphosphate phosphatase [Firmicutes bacterium]|nr:undecaprenyl-diphosphate phosphatase [Bacillota bacterium]